ncbi:MAG: sensor histidine kinase [Pirellula sp.]|nr:hypothetical protein [Planctomycetota bacterium]
MPTQVAWKLVYPMILLSIGLLAIGLIAAWNVHNQQRDSSAAIAKEVRSLINLESANIECREIRYRLNMFLRTGDRVNLQVIHDETPTTKTLLENTQKELSTASEQDSMRRAIDGFEAFATRFSALQPNVADAQESNQGQLEESTKAQLSELADSLLTQEVLEPLERCLDANQRFIEITNSKNSETAKNLMAGFLLLGICGGLAGTIIGLSVGRALGQSMIQLSVSIRDAAVRLSDARGVITLTQQSDLPGIQTGVRKLAEDIAHVVQQLQQRERELSRSEQLARLGQIAAGMAHELRNPLTPMKILVQAAMEKKDGGLKGRSLEVIYQEIMRQEKSIQAFLDFARPPNPEKSRCTMQEIINNTCDLVRGRCQQQSVELKVRLPDAPVIGLVDKNQICQLVLNLLLNALDAMPNGGSLSVELSTWLSSDTSLIPRLERDEMIEKFHSVKQHRTTIKAYDSLTNSAVRVREWIEIQVTDNGSGIDAQTMKTLFQPFSTTKETGSGLGLATCDRIAQVHSGVIEVESLPHQRTCFCFTFPKLDT